MSFYGAHIDSLVTSTVCALVAWVEAHIHCVLQASFVFVTGQGLRIDDPMMTGRCADRLVV